MKGLRLNKQHFKNWDIADLQEYVDYLQSIEKTAGNELTLSLAAEVLNNKLSEI